MSSNFSISGTIVIVDFEGASDYQGTTYDVIEAIRQGSNEVFLHGCNIAFAKGNTAEDVRNQQESVDHGGSQWNFIHYINTTNVGVIIRVWINSGSIGQPNQTCEIHGTGDANEGHQRQHYENQDKDRIVIFGLVLFQTD